MKVECPQHRKIPDLLWKHAESYHDLEFRVQQPELILKKRDLSGCRLEQRKVMPEREFFDRRVVYLQPPSRKAVGRRDHTCDRIPCIDQALQTTPQRSWAFRKKMMRGWFFIARVKKKSLFSTGNLLHF